MGSTATVGMSSTCFRTASFTDNLPRMPAELDVIVVRKEGATGTHHDFCVRRSFVLHALEWLIAHMYYRNVHINHDVLALLLDDGDLCGLATMTVSSGEEELKTGC